jgi:hypothetical protein
VEKGDLHEQKDRNVEQPYTPLAFRFFPCYLFLQYLG